MRSGTWPLLSGASVAGSAVRCADVRRAPRRRRYIVRSGAGRGPSPRTLEEAIDATLVPPPRASLWCAFDSQTGGLENPASLKAVATSSAFARTALRAVRRFRSAFGDDALISVVLSGSVARGAAVAGHSDVDLVAYVVEPVGCDTKGRRALAARAVELAAWGASSEARGPSRRVEMRTVCVRRNTPAGRVLLEARRYRPRLWRVGLGLGLGDSFRVHPCPALTWPSPLPHAFEASSASCTVHGADVCAALPRPTIDDAVPRLLLGLPELRDEALACCMRPGGMTVAEAWWFSRRLMRAGAELVARREGGVSRDVVLCFQSMRAHLRGWDEERTYLPLLVLAHSPGASGSMGPSGPGTAERILKAIDDLEDRFLADYLTVCGLGAVGGARGGQEGEGRRAEKAGEEDGSAAALPLREFASLDDALPAAEDARGPVVVRGGAASAGLGWRCAPDLDLDAIRRILGDQRVSVRVSRTLDFTFCEESHPHVRRGLFVPPSRLVDVPASEFFRRAGVHPEDGTLSKGALVPPPCLAFAPRRAGDAEFLYMQTSLPRDVVGDAAAEAHALARLGEAAGGSSPVPSQGPRLWACPAGAISPTHWDASPSFLAQLVGRKRMRLWTPADLPRLRPMPDGHPLRRRCRHDPRTPTPPDSLVAPAADVLLHPGDLLFFPPRWAHFTEALDASASATVRF